MNMNARTKAYLTTIALFLICALVCGIVSKITREFDETLLSTTFTFCLAVDWFEYKFKDKDND